MSPVRYLIPAILLTALLGACGVRELGLDESVDTETLFRIASTSTAFPTASLAILDLQRVRDE